MQDEAPARRTSTQAATGSRPTEPIARSDVGSGVGSAVEPAVGPAAASARTAGLLPLMIFAAIAGLFAFALMRPGDPSKIPSALIGRAAPPLTLAALEGVIEKGQPVPGLTPADVARGSPVIVNFWASWCVPCVDEHPVLVALKARTGATIYGINHKDQTANARRFLARYGNPFAAIGTDGNGRAAIDWGVYGMPETFIVDGAGIIVFKHVGPLTPHIVETAILPALEKAKRQR